MKARIVKVGVWMGMVCALCLGNGGAQTSNGTSGGGQNSNGTTSDKKPEKTAEQKAFEQSIKDLRAGADRANDKYVKDEQKREKAERDKEAAERTPSTPTDDPNAKGGTKSGGQGGAADSSSNGKGK